MSAPWFEDASSGGSGGGSGTVTSVAGGEGITGTPDPIVGAGTLDLDIFSLATEAGSGSGDWLAVVDVSVGTAPAAQRKIARVDLFGDNLEGLRPFASFGVLSLTDTGIFDASTGNAGNVTFWGPGVPSEILDGTDDFSFDTVTGLALGSAFLTRQLSLGNAGGGRSSFTDSSHAADLDYTLPSSITASGFLKTAAGGALSWALVTAAEISSGAALTKVDDTNVTLALGGSPVTALLAAASLTLGWSGQLSIARGGTGQATALAAFNALSPLTTRGDLLTRDASNNVRLPVGASPRILQSDGTDPSWVAVSADASLAAGGALTIANDAVTYAKIQNVSAASRVLGRITAGAGDIEELTGANLATIANASFDHGVLLGLADDDHAQYLLLAGRAGGQSARGGTAASETLTLSSTAHATKGNILFGTSSYDEVTNRLGVGITVPGTQVHVSGNGIQRVRIDAAGSDVATSVPRHHLRRARGTIGGESAVSSGDSLGAFDFLGHDGTSYGNTSAAMIALAAETFTVSAHGSVLTYFTCPIGAATAVERMRVADDGSLLVGTTTKVANVRVNVTGGGVRVEGLLGSEVLTLSSVATNDDPVYQVVQARLTTTNASANQTLQTVALTASMTYMLEARVVARRTGGSAGTAEDGASYSLIGTFKTVGGAATQIGVTTVDHSAESQAAWDANLAVSGANVLVRVTGAANNNIVWHATTIVQNVGT